MSRFIYPIITFICLIIVGQILLLNLKYSSKQKELSALNTISFSITQNIQQQITMGIFSTKMLESLLKVEDYDVKHFDNWAKEVLKVSPSVEAVQLAPNGVLKHVYPYEVHKAIIGHNLLSDKARKKGAQEAIKLRDIKFVGPLRLIQNDKVAVIARKPVFKNGDFWGFSIALIYIEDLIKDFFTDLEANNFSYELTTENLDFPDLNVIAKSKKQLDNNSLSIVYPINVPNGVWNLKINYHKDKYLDSIFLQIFLIVSSLFLSYLVYYFEKKNHDQACELKSLNRSLERVANTDLLTSLPNRRSAMEFMDKQLALAKRYKEQFSLCYVDLDHFKKLNDIYGHDIGDLALVHFSNVFAGNLRKSDMFARWGGEEFLLILPKTDEKGAQKIAENLRELLIKTPLIDNEINIKLTVSIGITTLQNRRENLDDIISRADRALYDAKQSGRNRSVVL